MVCSWLPRWLRGLARRAPRGSSSRADRAINVAVCRTPDDLLIRVEGDAGAGSAGALLDGLLTHAGRRPARVTLDLSELRFVSPLARGVLLAYCRSVVRGGGRVLLAGGLQPAVVEALARTELLVGLFPAAAEGGPHPFQESKGDQR